MIDFQQIQLVPLRRANRSPAVASAQQPMAFTIDVALPGGDGAPASCAPRLTPEPTLALALAALDAHPASGGAVQVESSLPIA
jgi:hypothetical protein